MKIILDIPDTTICAFINFVREDVWPGLAMQSKGLSSADLYDGAEIKIPIVDYSHENDNIKR